MEQRKLSYAFRILFVLPAVFLTFLLLPGDVCAAEADDTASGGYLYIYTLDADGIDSGTKYLIVSAEDGAASALTNSNGSVTGTDVTVSAGQIVVAEDRQLGWTITKRSATNFNVVNNGYHIYPKRTSIELNTDGGYLNIKHKSSGEYQIYYRDEYYYWVEYDNKWTGGRNKEKIEGSVYLYALTDAIPLPVCTPDAVVLDHGLPVDISVLSNDSIGEEGTLAGLGRAEDIPENGYTAILDKAFAATELTLDYGHAAVSAGQLRYTPDARFMHAACGESFAYAVACAEGYAYGTVTVLPAPFVYYEDEFAAFSTYSQDGSLLQNSWPLVGTQLDKTQAEDRPGPAAAFTDEDNPYGYDPAYLDMPAFSMGAARVAHVSSAQYAAASFSFTGTGFDLIGLTGNASGAAAIDIYRDGGLLDSRLVDTYYGSRSPDALYQVPVVKVTGLDYGRYDVVVTAAYSELFDHGQYGGGSYDFCLDAIRIYGCAAGETVENAWLADGEGWPEYVDLRGLLLETGSFSGDHAGVFIDGAENASMADYAAYGPKNEVYLAPGQAVVFDLGLDGGSFDSAHLGLRSLNGDGLCRLTAAEDGDSSARTVAVNTAADLTYDLTDLAGKTVVVTNTGDSILSLTSIKITYRSAPSQN